VAESSVEVLRFLSSHTKVNPRIYNDYLLRLAVDYNETDHVAYYLSAGCDIDVCDGYSLRKSCQKGRLAMVKVLLEAGADPDAEGGESLQWACLDGVYFLLYSFHIEIC
jgi:hypothetical protein